MDSMERTGQGCQHIAEGTKVGEPRDRTTSTHYSDQVGKIATMNRKGNSSTARVEHEGYGGHAPEEEPEARHRDSGKETDLGERRGKKSL